MARLALKYPSPVDQENGLSRKQRAQIARLAGILVVAEQRGAATTAVAIQAEEDQHRIAARVVVDVAPIGIADVVDAVAAAAIAAVGQTDAGRPVR